MGFWRDELIDFALDQDTSRHIEEQRAAIAADPSDPAPYYRLALLCRMQGRQDAALGLLLEAVRLDPGLAAVHAALAEIYAARDDPEAARRHADRAAELGDRRALEMLVRYR